MFRTRVSCATLLLAIICGSLTLSAQDAQVNRSAELAVPALRFRNEVRTRAEFDQLARVYTDAGYALPNVIFTIDRSDANKIYYADTERFRFHREFVNGTYLSLERGDQLQRNYTDANRRFIFGTIAYQTPLKRFTFEMWEGDTADASLIRLAHERIRETFFEPVAYKPNSLKQEEIAATLPDIKRVSISEIASAQAYQPLNIAKGIGRVHVIDKLDDTVEIGSNEIVVLSEVPIHLPPVAGIIFSRPATPLSHLNLLAKGWEVPVAYIKNANEIFRPNDTWWIEFETRKDNYSFKRAGIDRIKEYAERQEAIRTTMTPRGDLGITRIAALREQRKDSVIAYGGKSANLGELINARLPGISVPDGWTIPFAHYEQFMRLNHLDERLVEMLEEHAFVHNPSHRRARLASFRDEIKEAKIDPVLARQIVRRWRTQTRGRGVFVRSSSNTEDLPNFSGAGLHDSVPNVRDAAALLDAIKVVWASLWNFQAYEARERAGVDHTKVYMAVLVQEGINAESAGVMITTDPFDRENANSTYISAKRGLGIRVVEGKQVAEQLLYDPRTGATKVLTRSGEDSRLEFDARGGMRERALVGTDRTVLTDATVNRLAQAAQAIKTVFGGREQDIEWTIMRGRIYIVQSRPYIAGS